MRIAVLSDVHSNLEALEVVLRRARDEGVEATFVLGDLVGYGADPEAVLDRIAGLPGATVLAGNHDLAATDRFDVTWFNRTAAEAIRWTKGELSADARAYLGTLSPRGDAGSTVLVHGSVVDPAAEYVVHESAAIASFDAEEFPLCFFGHTHLPTVFRSEGVEGVRGAALDDGARVLLDGETRYMLNPGSVGQPRDGDPRASFMIFDDEVREALVCRVDYPVERAQEKIRKAGLPGSLADRLAEGR